MIPREPYAASLQPQLAPSKLLGMDIPLSSITYPKLMSKKYNGIRGLGMNGQWCSRNMSELRIHPEVAKHFSELLVYAKSHKVVLDGEFNSNSHNTVGETRSILAGTIPMPEDFCFKCFYEIPYNVWNMAVKLPISEMIASGLIGRVECVKQTLVNCAEDAERHIRATAHLNIEGWMFLSVNATYKHGKPSLTDLKLRRVVEEGEALTTSQETLLKFKYYGDEEDAKVVGLAPRKKRHASAPTKRHATGYAKQGYKQSSFDITDVAGTMICFIENDPNNMIYAPFPVGFDMEQRKRAYAHFGTGSAYDLQNEWICFRRLVCEDGDKPIAIKGVQFRDSKD